MIIMHIIIQVTFTASSGQLLSALVIVVTYQPPPIDRFLHIFHSDNAPMNKKLILTTSPGIRHTLSLLY